MSEAMKPKSALWATPAVQSHLTSNTTQFQVVLIKVSRSKGEGWQAADGDSPPRDRQKAFGNGRDGTQLKRFC